MFPQEWYVDVSLVNVFLAVFASPVGQKKFPHLLAPVVKKKKAKITEIYY